MYADNDPSVGKRFSRFGLADKNMSDVEIISSYFYNTYARTLVIWGF